MLLGFITGASFFLSGFFYSRLDLSLLMIPVLFLGFWLGLLLIAFLFLVIICAVVDLDKPQEQDSPFYRKAMYIYIEALKSLVGLKITVEGLEKTPKEGRYLLVCNHQNESDPGILHHYFQSGQLAFVAKKEARNMFVVGKIMHKTLCQMVNRENDREALKTILRCIQILKEDKASVAVFPEGGIDDDGLLHHFKPGVFKIAQKAGVPIVVCTLKNTKEVVHNIFKLKPSYVELKVLEVIPAEEAKSTNTVEIAHRCHKLMADDLGPELTAED